MATNEEILRLQIQGLDQIKQLDERLKSVTKNFGEAEKKAQEFVNSLQQQQQRLRGRAAAYVDAASRLSAKELPEAQSTLENVQQRRIGQVLPQRIRPTFPGGNRGRFLPGPNVNARRLAAEQVDFIQGLINDSFDVAGQALRSAGTAAFRERTQRITNAIPKVPGLVARRLEDQAIAVGQQIKGQDQLLRENARIDSRRASALTSATRIERGIRTIERIAPSPEVFGKLPVADVREAIELQQRFQRIQEFAKTVLPQLKAGGGVREQYLTARRYATQLESIGEGFREINRKSNLRVSAFESTRQFAERLDKLRQPTAAFPLGVLSTPGITAASELQGKALSRRLAEINAAARTGNEELVNNLKNKLQNQIRRVEREAQQGEAQLRANERLSSASVKLAEQREKEIASETNAFRKFNNKTGEALETARNAVSDFENALNRLGIPAQGSSAFGPSQTIEALNFGASGKAGKKFRVPTAAENEAFVNQQIESIQNERRAAEISLGRQRFREEQRNQDLRRRAALQEARQQEAARLAASRRLQETVQSAAIGVGFPLLFGQGAGSSIGGGLGGGLGAALFGGSAGFAGSIVGTAIGAQFDKLKQSSSDLAAALRDPTAALDALAAAGINVNQSLKSQVRSLQEVGRFYEAQALVTDRLRQLGGADYINRLNALDDANKKTSEAWSELAVLLTNEALPAIIAITNAFGLFAKTSSDLIIRQEAERVNPAAFERARKEALAKAGGTGVPGFAPELLFLGGDRGVFADELNKRARQILLEADKKKAVAPSKPANDDERIRLLDQAVQRQREGLDLRRKGEDYSLAVAEFNRDRERQILDLRKEAANYDREVTRFRKETEDRIADKRDEATRLEAELARQRRQLEIERLDQRLSAFGQVAPELGGGRVQAVDLAREYVRTVAEGQADLLQKETNQKLDIAKIQREASKFALDVSDKQKEFSDKANDYTKRLEQFKIENAKKIVDLQRQAADYQYEQWRRSYNLAAGIAEKSALARQSTLGPVEPASSFDARNSRGRSLIRIGERLGISPLDLALVIQAESGGNPGIRGGAGGNYQGLIQFGPSERRAYGYRRGMSFEEQLAAGGPVERYLKDRFAKAGRTTQGASLLDLYTTVLAGNPGASPDARDSFGNSARSQVRKIESQREYVRRLYFGGAGVVSAPGETAAPWPSADQVAGPMPRPPQMQPITGVPSALAVPGFGDLTQQNNQATQEIINYKNQLQAVAVEQQRLNELSAKIKFGEGLTQLEADLIRPLVDANQQLKDRAAYEREYGDLLKQGTLPAMAEQIAQASELERTQLRLNDRQINGTKAAIADSLKNIKLLKERQKGGEDVTEALTRELMAYGLLNESLKKTERIRGKIIEQGDLQNRLIQDANSLQAQRDRTTNTYNERINTLNGPNRRFDKYMTLKGDIAELVDPVNQLTNAAGILGDSFGNAFQEIISGSSSAKEALNKMFASIGARFLDMAAQILSQKALFGIMGLLGFGSNPLGGAASGASGLISGLGILNGNIFAPSAGLFPVSFDSGGYTGSGSYSGGIDGKGGFPAILHPDEYVVPSSKNPELRPAGEYMQTGNTEPVEAKYVSIGSHDFIPREELPGIMAQTEARVIGKQSRLMRYDTAYRRRHGL